MSKHKKKKHQFVSSQPRNDIFTKISSISWLQQTPFYVILLCILTIISYGNIFRNGLVVDDLVFIKNWDLPHHIQNLGALVSGATPVGQEGVYRPIRGIIYFFYAHIWGTNPFGYHLHSFMVLLLSAVALYFIAWKLTKNKLMAGVVSSLFTVSPIHTEAITYMTASMDTTGCLFLLVSFLLYLFWRESMTNMKLIFGSLVFATLAFFTYEVTIILPLVILLNEVCFYSISKKYFKNMYRYLVPFFAMAGVYLFIRIGVFGIVSRGHFITGSFYPIALATIKSMLQLSSLTLVPVQLSYNHIFPNAIESVLYRGYNTAPLLRQGLFEPFLLLSLSVFLTVFCIAIAVRKKRPLLTFSIGWILISLLPLSNVIPQYAIMHERFFYIPSVGLFLLVGYLLFLVAKPLLQILSLMVICVLLVFYSSQTIQRNMNWHDGISLWSHDIAVAPTQNAYAYLQLGNTYLENKQYSLAIPYFEKAYSVNPHLAVAIGSAAQLYEGLGKQQEAISDYKKAITADPTTWEAHFYLGNLYAKLHQVPQAILEYQKTLQIRPDFTSARNNIVSLGGTPNSNSQPKSNSLSTIGWTPYQTSAIQFSYPPTWKATSLANGVLIASDTGQFSIVIVTSLKTDESLESFLNKQTTVYGTLTKQGAAMIPQFDSAYVRVWQGDVSVMQFFLFKNTTVIELRVSPPDPTFMPYFDALVEGMKVL